MLPEITSFEELEGFFSILSSPGIRPGLDRIGRLLKLVGSPERYFPSVHIVGTNGKGSTAAFIESILRSSGYSTALYTSPHLESPSERLTLRGSPAPLDAWSASAFDLNEAIKSDSVLCEDPPSFFEVVTAAAFMICARSGVDIAVVEAGLGGRLDATNLLGDVRLTMITSISMDHTDFLGDSIEQVASEKFAVMRESTPALFSGDPDALVSQFLETAASRAAKPHLLYDLCKIDQVVSARDSLSFVYRSELFSRGAEIPLRTMLLGSYQVENCALAVTGSLLLSESFPDITNTSIVDGVRCATWPGRFETLLSDPVLILDGAHNPGGMKRLVNELSALYGGERVGVVYGSMRDKPYPECLALLRRASGRLYCVPVPGNARSATPEQLTEAAVEAGWGEGEVSLHNDPIEAIHTARTSNSVTVCCGSLYLVGYVRSRLSKTNGEGDR
ncbi:MAG: folylpolyglutamate synthase/dihydrofolate synthase family protein [Aminobacteriaceae bacterium]